MPRIAASELRKELSATLNRVAYGKDRVVLHRHGKDLAAIIPIDDLEVLEKLEDRIDLEEARRALADPKNRKRVSWQTLKAELGL
jgi:prevent-host-death family protein